MRLRAVIIDDEETGIATLKLLVEKHVPDLKVVAECTHPREAIEVIEDYRPDVVFLDISMPDMDGFELLSKLEWREFSLIFTTAHQEHVVKAIRHDAIDYLLKPVYHKDLRAAIDRVKRRELSPNDMIRDLDESLQELADATRQSKLGIPTRQGCEYVDPSEMICLNSNLNNTVIYLINDREILSTRRLGEFESMLCTGSTPFMRVHHSYIINLHRVARFIKDADDIMMSDHRKIPLAKSRREHFFRWMEE